ncbi:prepilin-type N-terminal cleavage/methylation domain-containing protein [Denitratisoma oestradiolicum]|uniref:Prepilin-type cleavage/methylation domain-containing protein n=1 Tax=Denitratisoma oestradiolicum TaxID=311182 RepID=A0A6S6XY32_9PROT|nr:prepilin-type N-terminal cleavage/methylation domain-containing protein [Denitratisoma oestradiolicum]CAB1369918.1 Prepilin-type cleavage/methylation domain-containing protein [Denitratisoma oestradiolicum]
MPRKQDGYTLIEIAIVLIIIGLLLGGVLKGQELITQAKIRNIINDLNGVTTAIQTYQDRYRALPGDDPAAAGRWQDSGGNTLTTVATNPGDGRFDGAYGDNTAGAPGAAQETLLFWQHLRLAGFIPGPASGPGSGNPPANAAGGLTGIQTRGMGFNGNIVCLSNLPDKVAIAVDGALDDGNALIGQIRAKHQTGPSPIEDPVSNTAPGTTDAYVETGNNQYLLCKSL